MSEAESSEGTIASGANVEQGPDLRKNLSEASARHLENQAWSIVPELFQSVSGYERLALLEVGCEPESPLTIAVQQLSGTTSSAARCFLLNGCDLGESSGLKLVMQRIEVERPQLVWLEHEPENRGTTGSLEPEKAGRTESLRRMQRLVSFLRATGDSCGLGNDGFLFGLEASSSDTAAEEI